MDNIEKVSNILYEYFNYVYCDTCRYNLEVKSDACDFCIRKSMGWEISRGDSNYLARRIIEELKG